VSRSVRLEVLTADGWTRVTFEDIDQLRVAGAPGEAGLTLTLIGIRDDGPNHVETGVLDVVERHRSLLGSEVPTVDGVALPVAQRDRSSPANQEHG
jgi:hypothetical protein